MKSFSFAALMSIVTRRNLASTLDEQYDLPRHLTGVGTVAGKPEGEQLYERAQEALFRQFPQLGDGLTQFACGKLVLMLETEAGKQEPQKLILGWLSEQSTRLHMSMDVPIEVQ